MPKIISKPIENRKDVSGIDDEHHFGYFETQGARSSQEDALAWHVLNEKGLIPSNANSILSAEQIAHRLWTSYQLLENDELRGGTTASTTVYDGKGNLITATLADAVSFAVVCDKQGLALGVIRLNSVTHSAAHQGSEQKRITAAGGLILENRVKGILAVTRAIGDNSFKTAGVVSEAQIDITHVNRIIDELQLSSDEIGNIQIIITCDGFTDGAKWNQTKKGHEEYLLSVLQKIDVPGTMSEVELAEDLARQAIKDGSMDNVSVAIQTITEKTPAFLLGVYDGHGGKDASCHVADNIGEIFKAQCALTPEAYPHQSLSVEKKKVAYERDNVVIVQKQKTPIYIGACVLPLEKGVPSPVNEPANVSFSLIKHTKLQLSEEEQKECEAISNKLRGLTNKYLSKLLDSTEIFFITRDLLHILSDNTPLEGIQGFYAYLAQNSALNPNEKNIDIIKKDTHISATNFLKGVAIIAATLATGILPGLLIAFIVYKATGNQPLDLFKGDGQRFEKELEFIKRNITSPAFFTPQAPPSEPDPEEDQQEQKKPG